MNEKRFTCKENLLFDNEYYIANMRDFEGIVALLNKLNEENSELKEAMKRLEYLNLDYPKGCIIGKATLTDCLLVDDKLKEELKRKDKLVYQGTINSKDKEYAFKLENISKVKPVFTKGKLCFWEYCEDDIKVL